jgi:osmotically-inducible protein OsmY
MYEGDVLLGGFVSSDWDLIDAMRIARKAAGNRRVVNNLSIELGGRK